MSFAPDDQHGRSAIRWRMRYGETGRYHRKAVHSFEGLDQVGFAPGPFELLILGFLCLIPLTGAVVLIVVLNRNRKSSGNNANLEPCPDCGRSVSLSARACPHCGCPLE